MGARRGGPRHGRHGAAGSPRSATGAAGEAEQVHVATTGEVPAWTDGDRA
ncbi:hypothetical protein Ae406Ps2_1981c [Pseudonocardia sp. Ae406_Ps2]|nr:hypothetical protein Ae406Ps2_1981c [Pseudonocardia sp. Ae406_Ps2]OLM23557.1 hypothetical protein Ae706Ps2_1990c [Pseudonocardia sp. Ae706_Ps2]